MRSTTPHLLLAAAVGMAGVAAQNSSSSSPLSVPNHYVWGAVVVNLFGDRIPLLSPNYSVITPSGQTQMYEAGQLFRDRYISPQNVTESGNTAIQGFDANQLIEAKVNVTAMAEVWVQQSAQAFMEGLYPPLNDTVSAYSGGPLNSLQNPEYYIASSFDPVYATLNGSARCPSFDASMASYMETQEFKDMDNAHRAYYQGLNSSALDGAITDSPTWFGSAYEVWDWLQHRALNDSSLDDAKRGARAAADEYMTGVYGNTTADNGIRALGGRTLAAQIYNGLASTMATQGEYYALNLFFTGPEPLISLAALMSLSDVSGGAGWTTMPDPGSSLVFELFSFSNGKAPSWPANSADDMFVRVLLRNGTNSTTNLDMVSIFGSSTAASEPVQLSWQDFSQHLFPLASSISDWCAACDAVDSVFCPYYAGLPAPGSNHGAHGSRLHDGFAVSPPVAGAIGALVTLAVVGLALLAAMLLGGIRFTRRASDTKSKPRSTPTSPLASPRSARGLGGFKGSEKLASDVDLPAGAAPPGEAPAFGASVVPDGRGGHRRVESWELREARRLSGESQRVPASPHESV